MLKSRKSASIILTVLTLVFAFTAVAGTACNPKTDTAESPIESVTAIGFVDIDGPKLKAIALEYGEDMTGADISADTYSISVYESGHYDYIGNGSVGDITDVYVNAKAETSESGGTGSGNYVIIEVFTDYLNTVEQQFTASMTARVKQVKDIALKDGKIIPASNAEASNLIGSDFVSASGLVTTVYSLDPNGFVIPDIEGFEYYTDYYETYPADGPCFVVENCFNQQDGQYYEERLSYALCLPEDYDENGTYAMVTVDNPATTVGTHPLFSVLATRSPAVYASDWAQQLVKEEHGVDGLIVVVPVITERGGGEGGCTTPEYQAVVALWDYIIETYHVDTDYIYATGQSVGGMELIETNRNRDNFFAGLLLYEDQWTQNYYPETIFERDMTADASVAASAPMHYSRTDSVMTWDYYYETDGSKNYEDHDPYNFYYLVSDDNIMIMNGAENNLSFDTWAEMKYLYYDTVGYDLVHFVMSAEDDTDTQNALLETYLNRTDDALNINWIYIEGGTSGYSCRKLNSSYEWLLKQSRQTEIAREKLDINKPFELAESQIQTEDRMLAFSGVDGEPLYYLTAKAGSGTQFYNSCQLNLKTVADKLPGWLPEGMSWETGVYGAHIQSVSKISDKAIAIELDKDMTDAVVRLKGDEIIGLDGTVRQDITFALAPFDFFDESGNLIDCVILNVYVNSVPETRADAARGSGSGCYLIVEFQSPLPATPVKMIQRTTIRTNMYILSALPWGYEVAAVAD